VASAAGDPATAADRWRDALALCPTYAKAAIALGRALLDEEEQEKGGAALAAPTTTATTAADPALASLARFFVEDGLRSDPGRASGWRELGRARRGAGAGGDAGAAGALRTAAGLALASPVMSYGRLPPAFAV
jgi:cytochrome c-type biogenesis protein CcmH/NrfG